MEIEDTRTSAGRAAHPPEDRRERLAVLHVVDSLEYGGLERVVTDLAIRQSANGHRVAVFSLVDTDGHRHTLEAAGIRVVQGGKRVGFDRAVLRRLREAIASHRADVVHTHNFVPNYHAAFALATMRCPLGTSRLPALVTTCHDMGFRLDNRRLRWLFRASLLRTARVAMVSRQVADRFVDTGMVAKARVRVVLNGIPVERFTPIADATPAARRDARAAIGLPAGTPPDAPLIGAVGRLVELKNHRALIDAMPALLARHPELRLAIIGGGPLRDALAAQARALGVDARVHLAGEHDNVAPLLVAFDVFALPSKTEGLSIALLEAFASGLAVVASAVGGNPDIVDDGRTGLLYRPAEGGAGGDPALTQALQRLLDDPALGRRLGGEARRWVEAHGSIGNATDAYDAVYREARDARPARGRHHIDDSSP